MSVVRFFLVPRMGKGSAVALVMLFICTLPAGAAITGSIHDFSAEGWSGGQICYVCHTPHMGAVNVDAPLWNHTISTAVYTTYSSSTMDVPVGQPTMGSYSRMCLSCHDGSIAIDSFGGTGGARMIQDYANLGTDLSDDHPIGIQWVHQTQSNDSTPCVSCHDLFSIGLVVPGNELKFFGFLGNRTVECFSCHDVHNSTVMDVKLLRKPLANSEICMHCHPK